jgi:DNA-binding beta-propeller fold protein YncE
LTQLPGGDGCLSIGVVGAPGCRDFSADLNNASSIAVSPDGRHVYATIQDMGDAPGAVIAFERKRRTGALTQLPGARGCIVNDGPSPRPGCATARALKQPSQIVLSGDGGSAYVTTNSAVAVLARDRGTGTLTQLPGGMDAWSTRFWATPRCSATPCA